MHSRTLVRTLLIAAAAGAVAAVTVFLVQGERYRLYSNPRASHCWAALRHLSPPSSKLELTRVDVEAGFQAPEVLEESRAGDPSATLVEIGYRQDRVLAGLELEIRCLYTRAAEQASSIEINGAGLDPDTLASVNDALR